MKIANRHILLASWLVAGMLAAGPAFAVGAVAAASMPLMPTVAATAPTTYAAGAPVISTPKIAAMPVGMGSNSDIKIPDLSKPLPGGKKDARNDMPGESKVPDSVRNVIKNLSNKTEDVTLDDLNAAREAVAKLDALIDIEKRLFDLDKIRNEREKQSEKKLIDALPKTALMPPPSFVPSQAERMAEMKPPPEPVKMAPPPPPKAPGADVEIIRIEGSNSRYGALVRDAGSVRLVHSGDHLSDGSVVASVNTQGVEFAKDNSTHMAQIKDVQAVFGDSP